MHDLVIRGGMVVDGTGRAPRIADVAVDGGLISKVGAVEAAGRIHRGDDVVQVFHDGTEPPVAMTLGAPPLGVMTVEEQSPFPRPRPPASIQPLDIRQASLSKALADLARKTGVARLFDDRLADPQGESRPAPTRIRGSGGRN